MTTTLPPLVRCADCAHWNGRGGWCRTAKKVANSARGMRRCSAFERHPERALIARQEDEIAALSAREGELLLKVARLQAKIRDLEHALEVRSEWLAIVRGTDPVPPPFPTWH